VVGPTADRLMKIIAEKPPGYYYRGYRGMDAEAEATQRALFANRAAVIAILKAIAAKVYVGEMAVLKQKHTSYVKLDAPPLDGGTPGQSDGSGDLIPKLLVLGEIADAVKKGGDRMQAVGKFTVSNYPALPHAKATVTDILSTWKQAEHPFGQIDGSVKSLFYRNIAAILAIVGNPAKIDYYNAQISGDFIDKLPAPPYPFDVDMVRAEKGQALYKTHCAICHQPEGMWKGKPFNKTNFDLGTDPNRAEVLNKAGEELFVGAFKAGIPRDLSIKGEDGKPIFPATLGAADIVFDRTKPEDQGYVTNDLTGLWARAPYLHNGSVPTLRHLLAPRRKGGERPVLFVRGTVGYDKENVGFQWETRRIAEFRAIDPTTALFDTKLDGGSNAGHDRDVEIEGVLRRLDWSKDEHAEDLGSLLEYLKTL
jgi:mono/diheme cytochrome c family protein